MDILSTLKNNYFLLKNLGIYIPDNTYYSYIIVKGVNMQDNKFEINNTFSLNKDNEEFLLSGMAIHEGRYRDIFEFEPSEISKCSKSIKNAKLMKDHSDSIDDIIGVVKNAKTVTDPETGTKAVQYSAEIDPDETKLIEKIKKGYVDSVSIGFSFEPYCSTCHKKFSECSHWFGDEDDTHILVRNTEIPELSLVYAGEDRNATVGADFSIQKFKEEFKELKSDFMTEKTIEELQQTLIDKENEISEVTEKFEKKFEDQEKEFKEFKEEKLSAITKITAERNQFEKELKEASVELEQFHKAVQEQKDAELSAKVDKVYEIATKFGIAETIDLEDADEKFINSTLKMLEDMEKNAPQIGQFSEEQKDSLKDDKEPTNKFHIQKFFN